MYTFDGFNNLGYLPGLTVVGTAAANVGVNAYHAVKTSKLQQQFQKKLESDEEKKEYIKFILLRMSSIAERLGTNGVYRPGTEEFEKALAVALKSDMNYKGNCNADIYYPLTGSGTDRQVWATIDRTGYVKPGAPVPPDVGPIWATGCKNAHDAGRMAYIQRFKGEKKHEHLLSHKEDIGTIDVLVRAGLGILMVIMLVIVTRVQRAVIKEQKPIRKQKPVRKQKPA